jgi:hypothetical protein
MIWPKQRPPGLPAGASEPPWLLLERPVQLSSCPEIQSAACPCISSECLHCDTSKTASKHPFLQHAAELCAHGQYRHLN